MDSENTQNMDAVTATDDDRGAPDRVEIEWLILADSAQAVGGKIYIMGGGWDTIPSNGVFPFLKHIGIAAAIKVPWHETNRRHTIQIEIADQDGQVQATMDAQMEVGRPVGTPLGHTQRVMLAVESIMPIPAAGTYVITARAEGREGPRVSFNVTAPAA